MSKIIYHYHATKEAPGGVMHIDGIAIMTRPVMGMDDYRKLKVLIAEQEDTKDLVVRSLSRIGETKS